MRLNAVKILKISVTTNSKEQILEEIQKYLSESTKKGQKIGKIFTPNTEQLVFAAKNSRFADVLNRADVTIPDTTGVVWAGHMLTKNGPQNRIPGVEFMEDLVRFASHRHVPIGLIGGYSNLAIDTLNCLQQKYPTLSGWATEAPEFTIDQTDLHMNYDSRFMNYEDENREHTIHKSSFIHHKSKDDQYFEILAKRIEDSGVRIVFVALGPPKQELYIEALSRTLSAVKVPVVLMAVGGSFDILSGRLPRAPLYFRKLGLEWFWRLILEPRRIFRQLALIEFVWLVLREKYKSS